MASRVVETFAGRIDLRLFHSQRKAYRLARGLGLSLEPFDGHNAWTFCAMSNSGEFVAVVLMTGTSTTIEESALLAHEAVHVKQRWLSSIGEGNPGTEEEAYIVQSVLVNLLDMHELWKRKHK